MSPPARRLLTDAVVAFVAATTAKPCGNHNAPVGEDPPYTVVWSIPGGRYLREGLVAPDGVADLVYQVDSVGKTPAQAEALGDRVRAGLLGRSATGALQPITAPPGLKIADRAPDGGPPGVEREGQSPHFVFTVPERYVLRVVPA